MHGQNRDRRVCRPSVQYYRASLKSSPWPIVGAGNRFWKNVQVSDMRWGLGWESQMNLIPHMQGSVGDPSSGPSDTISKKVQVVFRVWP